MKTVKMSTRILFLKKKVFPDTEKSALHLMLRRKNAPRRIRNAAVLTSRNIRKNRLTSYATQE